MRLSVITLCLGLLAQSAAAAETLETAVANHMTVPYVLTLEGPAPRHVAVLYPGGDGVVAPHIKPNGRLAYKKKPNFLVRTRALLVDKETAAVLTDAVPDAERFKVLAADIKRRFPKARIYVIGTSRGPDTSMHLARKVDGMVDGFVHTSSLATIQHFDPRGLKSRQLLIHHKYDACKATPYWAAKRAHEKYEVPLITITGGVTEGNECQPWAYHGFNGREAEVIDAIKSWMQQKH